MKTNFRKTLLAAISLLMLTPSAAANTKATPGDTIRSVVPLFDPIVVEDSLNVPSPDGKGITLPMGMDADDTAGLFSTAQTNALRSGAAYKVGTPTTDSGVSPLGAATWSLTFEAPPGVGGLTPQVGLAYSSQSAGGNAGWGISISGISCITRGMKTLYHDEAVRGIKNDAHDALFLDGRRLLLSSGTEGTTGAVYYPEGDPYTSVRVTSSNSYGPLSFEVTASDGMTHRYGTTANARLTFTDGGGVQRVHAWYVSRQEDAHGNYVTYSYLHDHLVVYPETIAYGKNSHTGTGADNYIRFTYSGVYAGTLRTFVLGGVRGGVYKCLTDVRTMTGSVVYREYVLNYDPSSDGTTVKFERLTSVTCKNGVGEEMKPVTLEWNNLPGHVYTAETLDVSMDDANPMVEKLDSLLMAADLNGDGLADIVRISYCRHYLYNYPNAQYSTNHTYVYIYRSTLDANGAAAYLSPLRYDLGGQINFDDWKSYVGGNAVADIDGDGLNDIVIPNYDEYSGSSNIRFDCILGKDVRSGTTVFYNYALPLTASDGMVPFASGDFDGNGIEDMMILEDKQSDGYYHLGISFSLPSNARDPEDFPVTLPKKPKRLFTGDFNCDGLVDIIVIHDDGYKIFYNIGGPMLSSLFSNNHSSAGTSFGYNWRMEQGDFNGDGLVDFVYVGGSSPDYYFALNNGDGTFAVSLAIQYALHDQNSSSDNNRFTLTPMDINRDGTTDLVVAKCMVINVDIFQTLLVGYTGWLLSDGSSLTEVRRVRAVEEDEANPCNIMLADFDGDGWPELANNGSDWYTNTTATNDGCHVRIYHAADFTAASGKLARATDALGAYTAFTYGTTADPSLYTHDYATGTFPMADAHMPMALVGTMAKNDGMTGIHTTTYRYAGLKLHLQGKGALGFMDIAARDDRTGVTTQNGTLAWNTDYYIPSSVYSVTSMGYDRDSTATTFAVSPHTNARYTSFPSVKYTMDMDGNETTAAYTFHTAYGRMTKEHIEYGSPSMYRETEYSLFERKGGKWLPKSVTRRQKHAHDASVFQDVTRYTYDAAGDPLTRTEHYGQGTVQLTTTYTRDSYGNVLSSTPTGNNVPSITSYTVYDATGRFPVRRYQSVDSGENLFTYDTWGHPLTETDAAEASNPLTTAYTLDGWGDPVGVTSPEGVVTTLTEGWASNTSYYVEEQTEGKAAVKTWYDCKGRVSRTLTKGHCNQDLDRQYTLNGWGGKQQEVNRTGTRVVIEMSSHDHRGRPSWTFRTGSGTTYYSYGNRSRTATHNGRAYDTTYDAWGGILESTDPACTVSYTYGSQGLPVEVETDGSSVTMAYDAAGRRTRLDDPDAGTSTTTYTADGRTLTHTDGRGVTTTNSYDALGRLSQSVSGTLTTAYTYGIAGHDRLRLKKVETDGMSTEYTYDQYGRVVFDKRDNGDGFLSGHTYHYDAYGRLSRHRFPSGLDEDYAYDANGCMSAITCNGTQVWGNVSDDGWTAVDGFGNTTLTTKRSQAGQLTESYVLKRGQETPLYRMAYTWDAVRGNLSSRTGMLGATVTETFTYDDLDRLTGVSVSGQGQMAVEYGDGGNILSKTGLGAYTYGSARPHAVTGVENTGYVIQSAAQHIDYNPWGKASRIEEGQYSQTLRYGPDRQRWKVVDSVGVQRTSRIYPHANYEWRNENGVTRQFHYLENGILVLKENNNDFWYFRILTDNVGSVVRVIDSEGTAVVEVSYDAWGKPTVALNQMAFPRGFGGHEMLTKYRLVNMDGRLYDYELGRFLSPDDYVQEPSNSQNFNRYTYCLNNPLKYTDSTGELFGIDDFIIGAAAFISSYVVNGISSHNWGWKSVQNGLLSAGMSLVGLHIGGKLTESVWSVAGKIATNNIVNTFMPSINIPFGNNFSVTTSPVFGFGSDGFTAGMYGSVNYTDENFAISLDGGVGNGYVGWKAYARLGDVGFGFGKTTFSEKTFNGNYLGQQTNGTYSFSYKDIVFGISNDLWGDGEDRWRTTAAELTIGNYSVGTYVYGNHGKEESEEINGSKTVDLTAPLLGHNKREAWRNGKVYFAPFWVGYKHNGQLYRIGYSHPMVQNLTQNLVHKHITPTPYFLDYERFSEGFYSYYGKYNPISIW